MDDYTVTRLAGKDYPHLLEKFQKAHAGYGGQFTISATLLFWESASARGVELIEGNRRARVFLPKKDDAACYVSEINPKFSTLDLFERLRSRYFLQGEWTRCRGRDVYTGFEGLAYSHLTHAKSWRHKIRHFVDAVEMACDSI